MIDVNPFLSDHPAADASKLVDRAQNLLVEALLSGSTRHVRAAVSFLKLKYAVSYSQLASIAELLFAIFEKCAGNVADEVDVAASLTFVLKQLNKSSDCPRPGSPQRITIPWRPIYDALVRVQMHNCTWEEYSIRPPVHIAVGAEARKAHGQALVGLVRRARSFFPEQAASEMIQLLRPFLCPHENSLFRAVGLLCLMLPESVSNSFILEAVNVWSWIPNCLEWTYLWIHFFSRISRHSHKLVVESLQSSLPRIFESLLFLLELPSSKDSSQRPDLLVWPSDCSFLLPKSSPKAEAVKKMTRLIVYTLSPQSCTKDLLSNFVEYVKPFFHPLNEGGWTSSLDMFLKMLTLNFTKRVGFESGAHKAKRPWEPICELQQSDKSEFVNTMLPLALAAFDSKDHSMSFGAAQALKDLVSIQPEAVLPVLLDRLVPALENSMKPHEALNAMEAFSVTLGSLLRTEGGLDSPVLVQMIQQTLAGIDNNDPMKTVKTLRLYSRIVNLFPLMHPSDMVGDKPELVFIMPDWTAEVLDRLWKFLSNVPSIKKGSGLDYVLSNNVLRQFLDNFLQQMSPTLYKAALTQICQKVSTTYYPPGKKYFGQILSAAVYCNPSSLKDLVTLLSAKILQKDKCELTGNGSETAYWVHLLGHVVSRGGEHLLPFSGALDSILDLVVLHDDKDLRKEGQKLLRKTLRSYLMVFPVEVRSVPPVAWNSSKSCLFSGLVHPHFDSSTAEIKFRFPDAAAQERAQALSTKFLAVIGAKIKAQNVVLAPASLRACLGCLEAILRGGASIFPETEASFESLSTDQDLNGSEIDENEGNVGLPSSFVITNLEGGNAIRQQIRELLQYLCEVHAVRENADVASVKGLLRVLQAFLSHNGFKTEERENLNYNKAVYRLWDKGFTSTYTRNMVVLKAQSLLNKRLSAGVWATSVETEKLLTHVASLCMHEYSVVRKKAQKVLPKVLRRYPRFADRVVSSALGVFGRRESTQAAVNGAIYTVNTSVMLKRIARQWEHTSALITGLLSSHHFEDIKVQVRLAELWNSFVPYTYRLTFSSVEIANSAIVELQAIKCRYSGQEASAKMAAAVNAKRAARSVQEASYDRLVATIEGAMDGTGKLHWRFVLLAASSISILLRPEKAPTMSTVEFFLQGLVSEVLPLRQLSRGVLPVVVNCYKQSNEPANSCPMETDAEPQSITFKHLDIPLNAPSLETGFVDCLWRGWDGALDPNATIDKCVASECTEIQKALDKFLATQSNVTRLCELMASDHRLSGDERATDAEKGVPGMPLPSAAVLGLMDGSWLWPRTPAASFSTAFNKGNVMALETILRGSAGKAREVLWPVLQAAITNHSDRESQCLAAELVAGYVRASTCWDSTTRQALQGQLESLIIVAFQNMPMEASSDWMEGLRFMVCNRDPRRFQWLGRCVAALTANTEVSTSSILNGLKLQQALLIEFAWRGYSFADAITTSLVTLLGGSSKSVREEAGRCLLLVSVIDSCLPSFSLSFRPISVEEQNSCSRRFLLEAFTSHCKQVAQLYSASSEGQQGESKVVRQQIEGILYYFIHAARVGRSSCTAPFIVDGLSLMLAVQEDADREFAQVGKIAFQLVSAVGPPTLVTGMLACAESALKQSSSWRVRVGALDLVRILGHRSVLDATLRSRALSVCRDALLDPALDVRQFAHMCFAGLLRMCQSEDIRTLISSVPKSRKRGAKSAGGAAENVAERHSKVLAVAAAILSHPTDVPEWMADAVSSLCLVEDQDPVIKQTIGSTIGEFKKTHQDMWPLISMTWTSEQISLVSDFAGARSYYS